MFFINVTDINGNTIAQFHESDMVLAYRIYGHLNTASFTQQDMIGYTVTIEKGY